MKHIYKFIALVLFFGTINSCDEGENIIFDVDNGQTALSFSTTAETIGVCMPMTNVVVESTTRSSSDRTFNIQVNASSTATPSEFNLGSTSVTIPAGDFVGSTSLSIDFSQVPEGASRNLILDLIPSDGAVINTRGSFTASYESVCLLNEVIISFFADRFPEETSISFTNTDTSEVLINAVAGDLSANTAFNFCLPAGNYEISVGDSFGDGFEAGAGVTGAQVECSGNVSLFPNIVGDINVGSPIVRTFTLN